MKTTRRNAIKWFGALLGASVAPMKCPRLIDNLDEPPQSPAEDGKSDGDIDDVTFTDCTFYATATVDQGPIFISHKGIDDPYVPIGGFGQVVSSPAGIAWTERTKK